MTPRETKEIEKFKAELEAKASAEKSVREAHTKSLERLYDYTKFHIGVILTLTTTFITVASVKLSESHGGEIQFLPTNKCLLYVGTFFLLLAGAAAGVIVSKIPEYIEDGSSEEFLKREIWPFKWECLRKPGHCWSSRQHKFFWAGFILSILSIIFACPPANLQEPPVTFVPILTNGAAAPAGLTAVTINQAKGNGSSATSTQYTVTTHSEDTKNTGKSGPGDTEGAKVNSTYTFTITTAHAGKEKTTKNCFSLCKLYDWVTCLLGISDNSGENAC